MSYPEHRKGCRREDHPDIGRRRLIEAGCLSLLGGTLADLLRAEAQANPEPRGPARRAKSVVFLFQSGGPSQFETWDPKPDAPVDIRGEYGTTATKICGVRFCQYLPRLAARADKFSIVRTMRHPAPPQLRNEHNSASYMIQTGKCELPPGETTLTIPAPRSRRFEWPSIGSTLAYALPHAAAFGLPPVVEIPRASIQQPGTGPGMLGTNYSRWRVDLAPPCHPPNGGGSCPNCFSYDQPNNPARAPGKGPQAWWDNSSCRDPQFRLPDLGVSSAMSLEMLSNRAKLLAQIDRFRVGLDDETSMRSMDAYRRQAWDLILGQKGKNNPFDLTHEPRRIRELYGHEEWGQAFLVARRLVQAGVRMVQVNLRGWDTHENAFRDLKGHLLPSLDRCLSGFLDDLCSQGLLDETLIVMCGEMGRTPRVSAISGTDKNASGEPFTPGRHHWGDVFPCFFAGGGTRPGQVIGQTDKHGALPVTDAYTPSDLAATIYHLLGVGPHQQFHDLEGRPHPIYLGHPIQALL